MDALAGLSGFTDTPHLLQRAVAALGLIVRSCPTERASQAHSSSSPDVSEGERSGIGQGHEQKPHDMMRHLSALTARLNSLI